MLTYTKANTNTITFVLTILLFVAIQIVINYLTIDIYELKSKKDNTFLQSQVYSKTIPISSANNYIQSFNIQESQSINKNIIQKAIYEKNNETTEIQDVEQLASNNIEENGEEQINQITQEEPETQREAIKTYEKSKWRIEIPRIDLNVHILEGITSEVLLKAVGHFEETAKWKGNVGLAAHNRGYNCNFFENVKDLEEGDEIIYYTTEGKRVYKVIMNKIIEETNWNYLKETEDNRITLITCVENRKTYRRCVQAVEVNI